MNFYFPINIGFLIIPIDELIFFRGVQTTNQFLFFYGFKDDLPMDLLGMTYFSDKAICVGGFVSVFDVKVRHWNHDPQWSFCRSCIRDIRDPYLRCWAEVLKVLMIANRCKPVGGLEHEFYFPKYWECHHPNWRAHFFQRGSNHQPANRWNGYNYRRNPLGTMEFVRG